jgi:hypothetical protein
MEPAMIGLYRSSENQFSRPGNPRLLQIIIDVGELCTLETVVHFGIGYYDYNFQVEIVRKREVVDYNHYNCSRLNDVACTYLVGIFLCNLKHKKFKKFENQFVMSYGSNAPYWDKSCIERTAIVTGTGKKFNFCFLGSQLHKVYNDSLIEHVRKLNNFDLVILHI